MQTNKIESIEGIRGVACLMVFLSHLSSTFLPSMHTGNIANAKTPIDIFMINSPFAFIYSGVAAVGIFFVLSGFILSYGVLNKGEVIGKAAGMAVKRYFRLMPPALLSCVIAFFIFSFIDVDKTSLGDWAKNYNISSPDFFESIWTGSVTPFFIGSAPYNWSLWTMKIEFFGSMALFFLCCVVSQVRYKKMVVLITMLIPFFMNIKAGDDIYYAA
ncbi:TPA: acyltransferase, partial [Proteus mirabilis]|nr:acyltransferase [Proteus mirabilis]